MAIIQPLQNSLSVFSKTFLFLQKSKKAKEIENIEVLKQEWAQEILKSIRLSYSTVGSASKAKSIIFVGNHISYLDIPLLLSSVGHLSFVAKEELQYWPIFGAAARRIDTVFVKRENKNSRTSARESVKSSVVQGKRIAIFPAGTTCVSESKIWKNGAFKIANEIDCLVQPFRIRYSEMRTAAYIDNDFFPSHLLRVCKSKNISATLEFHEPVKITDPIADCQKWQAWSKGLTSAISN